MKKISSALFLLLVSNVLTAQVPNKFEFTCNPYLQNMTNDGVTVFWMANKMCTSYVLWGETSSLGNKAYSSHFGQKDANLPIQKITLSQLTPGKTYFYKVVSKQLLSYRGQGGVFGDSIMSNLHSFNLPSKNLKKFSFLAFNDVHDRPAYIDTVYQKNKDAAFVCYNGDMMGTIEKEADIVNGLCVPSANSFGGDIPFVFTRGNHETRGSESRIMSNYVESPTGGYYYTQIFGNTMMIILDSGEDKSDKHNVYSGLADYDAYRTKQAKWLENTVQSKEWKKAKHRIVCVHFPMTLQALEKETETFDGCIDACAKFIPILNKANVDLVISGHTHEAKLILPNAEHNYTQVIGGGPEASGVAYIKVHIDDAKLSVDVVNKDGNLLYHAQLNHEPHHLNN